MGEGCEGCSVLYRGGQCSPQGNSMKTEKCSQLSNRTPLICPIQKPFVLTYVHKSLKPSEIRTPLCIVYRTASCGNSSGFTIEVLPYTLSVYIMQHRKSMMLGCNVNAPYLYVHACGNVWTKDRIYDHH